MKKKHLALGLVLTYICVAAACSGNQNNTESGSMASTETQFETSSHETSSHETTTNETTTNHTTDTETTTGNDSLLQDAGNAATDVIDGVTNGVNDVINGVTGSDHTNATTENHTTTDNHTANSTESTVTQQQ